MREWLRWLAAFGALIVCAACGLGDGTGAVAGSLFVRGCTRYGDFGAAGAPVAYDMRPRYFVADPVDDIPREHPMNHLEVRVQPTGNRAEEADVLFLNVANDRPVAAQLGQAQSVGPATNVRVTLVLNQTCPWAQVSPELDGTVTFSTFGQATAGAGEATPDDFRIRLGDRLAASFSLDVVDRRQLTLGGVGGVGTSPALAGHLAGSFDFVIRQGKAAQAY